MNNVIHAQVRADHWVNELAGKPDRVSWFANGAEVHFARGPDVVLVRIDTPDGRIVVAEVPLQTFRSVAYQFERAVEFERERAA